MCENNNKNNSNKNNRYESIIQAILNGDIDLYKEIVAEYKNDIFAVVYNMIRNYHTAEDLTQDVFIDAYIKLNSLADYNKLGAWLVQIAKNKCYNYLGREYLKHKRECEFEDYLPEVQGQTPEDYIVSKFDNENIEKAVKSLPDSLKTATTLFYFGNCSQKKIAEILNISENAVKSRLHDARLKLKKELDYMNTNIKAKLSDDNKFEEQVMTVINNLLGKSDDENFLRLIDEEIEKIGKNKNALGMLYYWRGAAQVGGSRQNLRGAKKDFEKSAEYLNDDNKYKGAAVSGIKIVECLEKDEDKYMPEVKMGVAGEVCREYDNKVDWLCNPGFLWGGFDCPQAIYYQIYLRASIVNKNLFNLDMAVGETLISEDGNVMTLISKSEKITVIAGTFENCLHINIKTNEDSRDIWYAKDIGLIKFSASVSVNYELCEYKVKGGKGYFPAAVGNLWNYKSIGIAEDRYYQFNEYEIVSVTEKDDGKYINLSAANCFKQKKI